MRAFQINGSGSKNRAVLSTAAVHRRHLLDHGRQHLEWIVEPGSRPGRDRHVDFHRRAEPTGEGTRLANPFRSEVALF